MRFFPSLFCQTLGGYESQDHNGGDVPGGLWRTVQGRDDGRDEDGPLWNAQPTHEGMLHARAQGTYQVGQVRVRVRACACACACACVLGMRYTYVDK